MALLACGKCILFLNVSAAADDLIALGFNYRHQITDRSLHTPPSCSRWRSERIVYKRDPRRSRYG
jgi:hypothetical protein